MEVDRLVPPAPVAANVYVPVVPTREPFEIASHEIIREKVVGDGSFGTVYRGICRHIPVAVKCMTKSSYTPAAIASFRNEVLIWSKLTHPNVNMFLGACFETNNFMIVAEFMAGDLETLIIKDPVTQQYPSEFSQSLSLQKRLEMFAPGIAKGMIWLHQLGIVHRDLKLSNILYDQHYQVKICDFGLSEFKPQNCNLRDDRRTGARGTPLWMAPEVQRKQEFNEKSDVYAFGLILWSLATREDPYGEFTDLATFHRAICDMHVRPPINPAWPTSLSALIQMCWAPNPKERPSFPEISTRLNHAIIDVSIPDPLGAEFWKLFFPTQFSVPWTDFIDRFGQWQKLVPQEFANLPLSHALTNFPGALRNDRIPLWVNCVRALVVDPETAKDVEMVPIARFGDMLTRFGPLTRPPHPADGGFLQDLATLLLFPWFHGDLTQKESEQLLLQQEPGTFLVRFSTFAPGAYTVSKVSLTDGRLAHHRILRCGPDGKSVMVTGNNGYTAQYDNLQELVACELQKTRDGLASIGLAQPCKGSRFAILNSQPGKYVSQPGGSYVT